MRLVTIGLALLACWGCAVAPPWTTMPGAEPAAAFYANPSLVAVADHERLWETVVDVVDDYFKIEREEPIRVIGNTATEGRLDTFPEVGATILEPWKHDSADGHEKVESTLQSIRRRAVVRAIPAQGGYWIDVAVLKELEDLPQPAYATAGAATFRYDGSLTRVVNPVGQQEVKPGWIPQGRDSALEQRILGHLLARLGGLGQASRGQEASRMR